MSWLRRWPRGGAWLCSALLGVLLGGAGAARAGCSALEPGVGLDLSHSRWEERDDSGRRLLRESGTLAGARMALALDCADWHGAVQLGWRSGSRDYRGLSSTGAAIRTHSDIEERRLSVSAWRPITGSAADGPLLSLGLRGEWRSLDRDLASAGTVLGYPERHQHLTVALGLGAQRPSALAGWQWAAELWLGGGPRGRVDLRLPHADPARLRSGKPVFAEAALALRSGRQAPSSRGWQHELRLSLRDERMGAGPAAPLWRHGVLVGAARQPQHRLVDAGLQAAAAWRF